MKQQIKTGDIVKVIAGNDKGKSAKVVKVAPREHRAFLKGIGVKTRHLRPTQYQKGGKKDIHVGIDLSNLKLEKASEVKPTSKKKTVVSSKSPVVASAAKQSKKGAK